MSWQPWGRYVPVAERRAKAARKVAKLRKAGRTIKPVEIEGRTIARTFWGKAWCDNLEAYSDYANRLPRGRTYARNGSVIDLQIKPGRIDALVAGTRLYEVALQVTPLPEGAWRGLRAECAGQIDSLVELLRGRVSAGVMEVVTRHGGGLFPSPGELELRCSCPDWAVMCKHVAASLYGVGARLDHEPEMLFSLRGVDPADMIDEAIERGVTAPGRRAKSDGRRARGRTLQSDDLSAVFGVDIEADSGDPAEQPASPPPPVRRSKAKAKTKVKARAKAKAKPSDKAKPTAKAKATATAKPTAKPKPATKAKTKVKPKAKAKVKPKARAKPTAKPTAKAKAKVKAKAKPKPKPKAKPKPKPKPKDEAKPQDEAAHLVLDLIAEAAGLRLDEIANCTGLSLAVTEATLGDLADQGLIAVIGDAGTGGYDLGPGSVGARAPAGQSAP